MKLDFANATLQDVPEIVGMIRALRNLTKESKVQTGKTQSLILRTVPAPVLAAVALELQKSPLLSSLAGEGR